MTCRILYQRTAVDQTDADSLSVVNNGCSHKTRVLVLRTICQSAQFAKRAAQFRNRACTLCKILT